MQLSIHIYLDRPLALPVNYNHILQGILYRSMGEIKELGDRMHERGFSYGKRSYRMFVFSWLKGSYKMEGKRITFYDHVDFQIRSPEPLLLWLIKENILRNGVRFGEYTYTEVNARLYDKTIEEQSVMVKMRSPLVVYSTVSGENRRYYYTPADPEFSEMLNRNFLRKYQSFCQVRPQSDILIEPMRVTEKDRLVTKYKGGYITGWYGVYQMTGERKYLDFLYQAGLGSKNAQGFGMFDVVK